PPALSSTPFPYTTLFRSKALEQDLAALVPRGRTEGWLAADQELRVENVRDLLRRKANVPGGVRLGLLLAGGFLLLCLVNATGLRSEEHTSELQSREKLVC